jgi:hypothetical protein
VIYIVDGSNIILIWSTSHITNTLGGKKIAHLLPKGASKTFWGVILAQMNAIDLT